MTLSKKIKFLRVENNMSQEKLAEILNVSRQSISKYENGSSVPDHEKLTKIVKVFDVTYDYLLDDEVDIIDSGIKSVDEKLNVKYRAISEENLNRNIKGGKVYTSNIYNSSNDRNNNNNTDKISIIDCTGKILSSYYKFNVSRVFKPKKNQPYAMLLGIDRHTFWGENTVMLGWYASEEDIKNEIEEIYKAIANKEKNYRLKYNVKIKKRGLIDIEIDDCK
ncbi:helix-turn-helix domain-containing protein [Metaclostridioides mangenotii]|uniref:helix-turn-helix domain-containing protein n=1 Tax=Metaclostridioides mangenotii TaxID=1540 RepID=UPI000465E221|nr:helix-turn-helix transcriptional regulator [Clostridioides mangenotii]